MNYKFYIRFLGPIVFIVIIYFLIDISELNKLWRLLNYQYLGLSLLTVPFIVAVRSIRWHIILSTYGMNYSIWRCFKYNFVEMIAVAFVSSAGSLIKIFYLRRDGNRLSMAVSSIFSDKAFDFLMPLLFGIFSAITFSCDLDSDSALIVFLIVIVFLFKPLRFAGMKFPPRLVPQRLKKLLGDRKNSLESHLHTIVAALDYKAYLLSLLGFLIYFLSIHFLNLGLGIEFQFSQIVCIMALTSLITAIPVSFLGIGTRDAALIVVFTWYGHSAEQAISLSIALLLLRISIIIMGTVFWLVDPPPLSQFRPMAKSQQPLK